MWAGERCAAPRADRAVGGDTAGEEGWARGASLGAQLRAQKRRGDAQRHNTGEERISLAERYRSPSGQLTRRVLQRCSERLFLLSLHLLMYSGVRVSAAAGCSPRPSAIAALPTRRSQPRQQPTGRRRGVHLVIVSRLPAVTRQYELDIGAHRRGLDCTDACLRFSDRETPTSQRLPSNLSTGRRR